MQNDQREKNVRERAYALYLARNGKSGSAEGDWRRAEQELADTVRAAMPSFASPSAPQAKPQSTIKPAFNVAAQNGRRHH